MRSLFFGLLSIGCLAPAFAYGQQGLFSFVPRPVGATGGKFEVWLRAPQVRSEPLYSLGFAFDLERISRVSCDPVATGAAISLVVDDEVSLRVPLPPGAVAEGVYVVAQCDVWFREREAAGTTFDLVCDRDSLDPGIECEDGRLEVSDGAPEVCDGDSNRDATVDVVELVRAVEHALRGCAPDSIFAPSVPAGE